MVAFKHRDDIQGLRAIAVLSVVLYHIDSRMLPSGFTGVDIFFVISGFLIISNLADEMFATGTVSLNRFWSARVKRLLPNASLTLVITVAAASALLPAYRLSDVVDDAFSSAVFYANYHFASSAVEYFRDSHPSVVLHFWSLSIEEQFYLGLPVLMTAAAAFKMLSRTALAVALLFLCVASFAVSLWWLGQDQPRAFFGTEGRVWQLALGGLAGILFGHIQRAPRLMRQTLAYIGLGGVVLSFVICTAERYPGLQALLPGVAAALLLLCAPAAEPLRHILASRPATWIGDRSYSLYLWHWPPLAIAAEVWPHSAAARGSALVAAFLLAIAAYRYVERPIHKSAGKWSFGAALAVPCSLAAIWTASFVGAQITNTFNPSQAKRADDIIKASNDLSRLYIDGCHLSSEEKNQPSCTYNANGDGQKTVVLFGDSHAAHWFDALHLAAVESGWKLVSRTRSNCPSVPVTLWLPANSIVYKQCDEWRTSVIRELERDKPALVVLANYSHYAGMIFDQARTAIVPTPEARLLWQEKGEKLVARLQDAGVRVAAVQDNPRMPTDYKDCLSKQAQCGRPRSEALGGFPAPENAIVLDFNRQICVNNWCPAVLNGLIIYQDENHLTARFASTFHDAFRDLMKKAEASPAFK